TIPLQSLLEKFGRHMAPGLVEMGEALGMVDPQWGALDILEQLPRIIFPKLTELNPAMQAPDIRTLRLRHAEVAIAYFSSMKFCAMMRGVIHGLSDYYQQPIEISEPVCMHRDAPMCRMNVSLKDPEWQKYVDVPREFESARSRIEEVKFFNQYQGVPFEGTGFVLDFAENTAMVQVSDPLHIKMMALEKRTHIAMTHLLAGLSADVLDVTPENGLARLNNIQLTDGGVGRRGHDRVKMQSSVRIRMRVTGQPEIHGMLSDVSIGGLAATLDKADALNEMSLFHPIRVAFSLLPAGTRNRGDLGHYVAVDGNVLDIRKLSEGTVIRVLFAAMPEDERVMIETFIKEQEKIAKAHLMKKNP
ncbi:MAG: heme NO-binding domain-containing protein, partial [Magnetococcales bacterium]|nr:heme NO-binding domain-containing protein [Magnetococcales bacterium]